MLKTDLIIRQKLIEQGYSNKVINYKEFLELYKPYQKSMSESDFANILCIAYHSFILLKNHNQKTIILKANQELSSGIKEFSSITQARKNEILETIKKQGYINHSIDYKQFLILYKPYKLELSERDFADILDISSFSFYLLKNNKSKVKILKYKKISEKRKEEIRKIFKKYSNKPIDYQEFLEFYKPYKNEMSEIDFANILGIQPHNYTPIKNLSRRTKISIQEHTFSSEKIIIALKNQGYTNKSIDYQEFLNLYEAYKQELSESEFANILGIAYNNYRNMKNKNKKTIILKYEKKELTEERKDQIKKDLIQKGYRHTLINYQKFLNLYEPYKLEMSEIDFANTLGISYSSYRNMKNQSKNAIILKEQISDTRKAEIINALSQLEYQNKKIDYAEFLNLYKPYKTEMLETEFAEILGISNMFLSRLKHSETMKTKILKNTLTKEHKDEIRQLSLQKEAFKRIKYILNQESRYYTKEELLQLCDKYEITLKSLLTYFSSIEYLNVLEEKGKLFIGVCKIDKEFQQKYSDELLNIVNNISQKLCYKHFPKLQSFKDDIASNTLLFILSQKGDIVLNSSNDETALKHIKLYVYKYEKFLYLKHCKPKTISLDEELTKDNIIGEMQICYNNDMNNQETMNYIMKKYNLSKEHLLEILTFELDKRKQSEKDKDANFYLGEEL